MKIKLFGRTIEIKKLSSLPSVRDDDAWQSYLAARGYAVDANTALKVAAVYRCVDVIAKTMAALPLHVFENTSTGKEKAQLHRLYPLLYVLPNPQTTAYEFWHMYYVNLLLTRGAFAKIVRDRSGYVTALYNIPTGCVSPIYTNAINGERYIDVLHEDGQSERLREGEFMFTPSMRFGSTENPTDPIKIAADVLSLTVGLNSFAKSTFESGAHPGGFIETPAALSDQAYERFKKDFYDNYGGALNAGKFLFLEEGGKANLLQRDLEKTQVIESRKFAVIEICRIFGVPPHKVFDLERATFCMPADVEVLTKSGVKSIADIVAGDLVYSMTENGIVLAPVLRSVCSGEDDILEIKTTNRTIRANAAHRICVRRKYPIPTNGIGGYQHIEWRTEYIAAGELKVGDTIVTLKRAPSGTETKCKTRELSVGFMEFCGLLLGDGNVGNNGVQVARAKTALYMEHYRDVMKAEFASYGKRGNGRSVNVATTPVILQEQERTTRFSSVLASRELKELGFSGTAHTKSVPDWVFGLTDELKLAFLRGYLDADGSVDNKGRITFGSANEKMLSQIRHLCIMLGVPVTNFVKKSVSTVLPGGKCCESEFCNFTCSDPGENARIGSHDPRYVTRFKQGIAFDKKDRNYPRFGGKGFNTEGCGLARIVSIKHQEAEPVYDLEVEGAHTFIANGVVVHNSNIEHQAIEFVQDCITPNAVKVEQTIFKDLLSTVDRKRYFAKFNINGLLRGDMNARKEYYSAMHQNGIMNADEIRALEDMNDIPDGMGKEYFMNGNMITRENASKNLPKGAKA